MNRTSFAFPMLVTLASTTLALQACEESGPVAQDEGGPITTPTGLVIEDLVIGTGETLDLGDVAQVHYIMWLEDGTKVDSSYDRGMPFGVQLGVDRYIAGWEEGLPGMRVGGERRLIIPPSLAYGDSGAGGVIPPDATLISEIELLQID